MTGTKLRRQITYEAARLMYSRQESEYYRAKLKAARRICQGWVKPADLPTNAEIRDEIQMLARLHEGDQRTRDLLDMRLDALRVMRLLCRFRPRLIGSVLTGHIRQGSDIDLHVFSDSVEAVRAALEEDGLLHEVEHKRVRKQGEERLFTHIHIRDRYPLELTVYATSWIGYAFRSSITGKAIESASIAQLEQRLASEYPDLDLDASLRDAEDQVDRFRVYESLLLPLENVKQDPRYHPEGDALYHSLQVFELAREQVPYDEELLLAALLHDVGKAIEPRQHVAAGLEALGEFVTQRTAWLIKHHMEAHAIFSGTLGARAKRRLQENESYEELLILGRCDRDGRACGVEVPDVDEALDYIRDLDRTFGV
jgi:predicted HD phosphohydrolase